MQDHRSHGCDSGCPDPDARNEATTVQQDTAIEAGVLALVLSRHPAQLTLGELTREMVEDPDEFRQVDAIRRAVRDLAGVGLLHRNGQVLLATQAALRFNRLTGSGETV
ncbi:MAG: hypothetical protein AB7F97_09420 [Solirubrobacterales bacterium]